MLDDDDADYETFKLPNPLQYGQEQEPAWDVPPSGRGAFVFLIDGSEGMYDKSGPAVGQCLEVCKDAMRNICRKQRKDLVAVVLFNTKETKGPNAPVNVVLLEDLAVPTVKTISNLGQIVKGDCMDLKTTYGHSSKVSLHEVLRYGQQLILRCKITTYLKYIVLFTCSDEPYKNNPRLEQKARKQVEEFLQHDVEFDVVGLSDSFDSSKFYKELVLTSKGEMLKDWLEDDPVFNMSAFITHLKGFTDLSARRLTAINLSSEYRIYVALHKLYAAPATFALKFKSIPTEAVDDGQRSDQKTLSPTKPSDNKDSEKKIEDSEKNTQDSTVQNYVNALTNFMEVVNIDGKRTVDITKKSLLKQMIHKNRGFELIGFVKTSNIPFYLSHGGEPYIVIPSLNEKNNTLAFSHLLNKCLVEELSIVCWFTMNIRQSPVLCALHPTGRLEYAPGRVHPPCFVCSKLWFSDNITDPDLEDDSVHAAPSENQLRAMKNLIKKTTLTFSVDKFTDVNYVHTTNMIEALAFGADELEEAEDSTYVKFEDITDDLAAMIMDCSHLVLTETASGTKRRGASDSEVSRPKILKKSADEAFEMVKKGLAHKLTVADLKNLLVKAGVKNLSNVTKGSLVEMANHHFGARTKN